MSNKALASNSDAPSPFIITKAITFFQTTLNPLLVSDFHAVVVIKPEKLSEPLIIYKNVLSSWLLDFIAIRRDASQQPRAP